jgi:peptidoglycan/xylan/chitin deacetylase (PgdA/CDA1 family)
MIPFRYFPIAPLSTTRRSSGRTAIAWRCGWCLISSIFHIELGAGAPDIRNHSRRDYGNRVGVWRLMEVLEKHGVRGTVALNGEVGKYYPRIMDAAISLHWEFMGHGLTNSITLRGMPREQEASVIAQTRGIIEGYGQKMYGWLGPSLAETDDTLNLLRGEGAEYVADWVNDDLPYRMSNGLYSIPIRSNSTKCRCSICRASPSRRSIAGFARLSMSSMMKGRQAAG